MGRRPLQFDFYEVQYEGDFLEHMRGVFGQSIDDRTREIRGGPVRLQELESVHGFTSGDFIRIRMDNLPGKASMSRARVDDLEFRPDEGVGEEAAFAYHAALKVIAFQSSKFAPTAGTFADYLSEYAGTINAVDFKPVIQETAQQRLRELETIRTFEIEVAGSNGDLWQGADRGMRELAAISARAGAPRVELTLKMGHEGGSMNTPYLKRIADWLSGGRTGRDPESREVTKLKITGANSAEETSVIDLIKDRMREGIVVGNVDVRRLRYRDRAGAAREAFHNRRDELTRLSRLRRPE